MKSTGRAIINARIIIIRFRLSISSSHDPTLDSGLDSWCHPSLIRFSFCAIIVPTYSPSGHCEALLKIQQTIDNIEERL